MPGKRGPLDVVYHALRSARNGMLSTAQAGRLPPPDADFSWTWRIRVGPVWLTRSETGMLVVVLATRSRMWMKPYPSLSTILGTSAL